jgi:hypothetical protein
MITSNKKVNSKKQPQRQPQPCARGPAETAPHKAATIKLGVDVHLSLYVVVRVIDGGTPRLMPNCSHSSLTLKRPLCANITNRIISSIGVTFFQGIVPKSVTHHPGSFVTYLSGSNRHHYHIRARGWSGLKLDYRRFDLRELPRKTKLRGWLVIGRPEN